MTRDINITVVSNLTDDCVYMSHDLQHGKLRDDYPKPTIFGKNNPQYNAGGQLIAKLHKSTGSTDGVTGNITYNLPNNSGDIVFMFNNPYDHKGSGFNGNCWLYPAIINIPAGSTTSYNAWADGVALYPDQPQMDDTMNITVYLNQNF